MHRRTLIRDKLVAILKSADTFVGDNVFANRAHPFDPAELPAIVLYIESETSERLQGPLDALKRTARVVIEVAAYQAVSIEDELDAIVYQVEEALSITQLPKKFYSHLFQSIVLEQTDISLAEDGDRLIGSARLTYQVEYET